MNNRRISHILVLISLILGLAVSFPASTVTAQPDPIVAVFIADNHIIGFHWPVGTLLTLTIDDPDTPTILVDYTATATVQIDPNSPDSTECRFEPGETFRIEPGHIVTLSGGGVIKTHIVTSLTQDGVDMPGDTLWGAADPGSVVEVRNLTQRDIVRWETADLNGQWEANFSVPGDAPGEDLTHDFGLGTYFMIMQNDEDGDHTQIDFKMPNPHIQVLMTQNIIGAYEYPPGYPVDLAIDDPSTGPGADYTLEDLTGDNILIELGDDFRVRPGHVVTMTNGFLTKTYTVSTLQVTNFDYALDTISGVAEPNAEIYVETMFYHWRRVHADTAGHWVADFSVPGGQEGEQTSLDLIPWDEGIAIVSDEEHDSTQVTWPIELSAFASNRINALNWYAGDEITLTIDDPTTPPTVDFTASAIPMLGPWFYTYIDFDIGQTFRMQPGHIVNLMQIDHSKTCIVSPIQITGVNYILEQITGVSNPYDQVQVMVALGPGDEYARYRYSQSDASGFWLVDFSQPGTHIIRHPNEIEIVDIVPNMYVLASVGDDNACFTYVMPNQPPQVSAISGVDGPIPVNTIIQVGASFTDPDIGDAHNALWDWGDGSASEGFVDEAARLVSGSHTYAESGVYSLILTLCDAAGECDQLTYQYVVVFDSSGGFVTGGGWFNSPGGAYNANPDLTGKATFGFVSKYKKGTTAPEGNTEFQFKAGDLNFHSTSYEWLVVAGYKAQFKGDGTINGQGNYKFMIWADDDSPDTFRIQIWDDTGNVYDNGSQQALGGGSIVVHK